MDLIQDHLIYYDGNDLLEDFIVLYFAASICYFRYDKNSEAIEYISKAEKLFE